MGDETGPAAKGFRNFWLFCFAGLLIVLHSRKPTTMRNSQGRELSEPNMKQAHYTVINIQIVYIWLRAMTLLLSMIMIYG
nr:hypothetical protein CFP56_61939 [Quercus suber]